METFVVKITPRRIERLIFLGIILLLLLSTAHYANKYYDTTENDDGYLDKIFSGTFFAKVPSEIEVNTKAAETIEIESTVSASTNTTEVTEVVAEGPAAAEENNSTTEAAASAETNTTVEVEEEPEETVPEAPPKCTDLDLKIPGFDTEESDGATAKAGVIEAVSISYCNLEEDKENYMLAELYIWDKMAKDEGLVDDRKKTPRFTSPQTIKILSGEKYVKTYTIPSPISIWRDEEFNYRIKFYYVDEDGDKLDSDAVLTRSGTYTIK